MSGKPESSDELTIRFESLPGALETGSTVLLAGSVDPATHAVGLRILRHFAGSDDLATVVTTTESADSTVNRFEAVSPTSESPTLGLVDMVSEGKYISAFGESQPVVYVPGPADIERLVVGLSDLTTDRRPTSSSRHLLVRSFTPILERVPNDVVWSTLERIIGLRTGSGLALFGIEYTAHDQETMATLAEHVDGILWVTEQAGTLEFEYRRTRGRHARLARDSWTDE